jgi:hypothetical protein
LLSLPLARSQPSSGCRRGNCRSNRSCHVGQREEDGEGGEHVDDDAEGLGLEQR